MGPIVLAQNLTYAKLNTSKKFDFIREFSAYESWRADSLESWNLAIARDEHAW